jgi:hypothetical protein
VPPRTEGRIGAAGRVEMVGSIECWISRCDPQNGRGVAIVCVDSSVSWMPTTPIRISTPPLTVGITSRRAEFAKTSD